MIIIPFRIHHIGKVNTRKTEVVRLGVGNPVRIRSCIATVWGAKPLQAFLRGMVGQGTKSGCRLFLTSIGMPAGYGLDTCRTGIRSQCLLENVSGLCSAFCMERKGAKYGEKSRIEPAAAGC